MHSFLFLVKLEGKKDRKMFIPYKKKGIITAVGYISRLFILIWNEKALHFT